VATPTVPGQPDQVDVNVDLEELPAGQLAAGLGYSQADGVAFNAAISQDNFIGTGKKVSLAFKTASAQQEYTVAYTNPYYTVDGVSRGFTFSHKATDFAELDSADYKIDDTILGVNFGIPLTEFNRFSFSSNLHFSNFEKAATASTVVTDWQTAEGTSYTNLDVAFKWTSDNRDSALMPTSGSVSRLSAEATVPGSTLGFYKAGAKHRRYFPMYGDLVFSLNGEVGYGDSYGSTSKLPFYENYYIGGPSSVRGYAARSIGPREGTATTDDPIGGNFKLLTNAEFYVPSPVYSDTMRLVAFADAGTVMDTTNDIDWNELRYSTGVGLSWMSPVGPLTLSYAKGLKEDSQDELESFQFTLGTVF
jgi:outer membrane protein insertion porin family